MYCCDAGLWGHRIIRDVAALMSRYALLHRGIQAREAATIEPLVRHAMWWRYERL